MATNNNNKRPDIAELSFKSRRGTYSKRQLVASAYLTVTKGFNEPYNQIAVQACDDDRKPRETALINITFADGTIWSGTFEKLQLALNIANDVRDSDWNTVEDLKKTFNQLKAKGMQL